VAWPGCVRSGPDDRGAGRLSRESADALCETKVSAHLAIAYRLLRRYDEAIAYAEASLSGTRAQAGQHLGRSLSNLGLLYVEAGRFEEGASLLEQSLAASRQAGDRAYESQAHCGLADACRGLGRHHDAHPVGRERPAGQPPDRRPLEMEALRAFGQALAEADAEDTERARACLTTAYALVTKLGIPAVQADIEALLTALKAGPGLA
jgi:tetratricopeptide (TPR) repeat protein